MLDSITLFIFLLFAHLVGDVLVRPDIVKKYKAKSLLVMVFHCFTYAGTVSTFYFFYTDNIEYLGTKFMFLFATHFIIDGWSGIFNPVREWFRDDSIMVNWYHVVDQFLHGLVISGLVFLPNLFWEILV